MQTIQCYTSRRAIPARTRRGLASLGYSLVGPSPAAQGGPDPRKRAVEPALRIVDDTRLAEIPSPQASPNTPLVLLLGARARDCYDPRVRAVLRRPPQLTELYCALQQSLEVTPRSWPRVAVELPARRLAAAGSLPGVILSLSRKGCLLRTSTPIEANESLLLQLAIPNEAVITADACCIYQSGDTFGIEFARALGQPAGPVDRFLSTRLAG